MREWRTYMIKATFVERPDEGVLWPEVSEEVIREHKETRLQSHEAQLFKLPNPILTSGDLEGILPVRRDGKECRIYPPFPLNEVKAVSGAFEGVQFPEGEFSVLSTQMIPNSAVKGLVHAHSGEQEQKYCSGLRLDIQSGFNADLVLKAILQQITQYTNQWWLRSPQAPFSGPLCLGAEIGQDFRTRTELRYRDAGEVQSTWYGARQTQSLLGIERPLANGVWLLCLHNVQNAIPAELGLLTFADAIAHYMAGEDERCILDLAIAFEILANKRLIADEGKGKAKNKSLVAASRLLDHETRPLIRQLIIDRDHVSHGRPPHILGSNPSVTIEAYLDAVRKVVNAYLNALQTGEFPKMAQMELKSTRSR